MPTLPTHAFVGAIIAKTLFPSKMPNKLLSLAAICACISDLDSICFSLGIPYDHPLGHRGFSHSLFFALISSMVITWANFRDPKFSDRRWRIWLALSLAAASHGFFDAMTNGGLGIAFFSPFSTTRYFLPWRPIEVAPLNIYAFFVGRRGIEVMYSEFLCLWLPFLSLLAVMLYFRKKTWKIAYELEKILL